ncbi:hypothetical protein [Bradyrhizobium diazoefficiens]|uniref:Uncharacterized protein n=1 Tax=Bradyrhizobium diazoefficiens TaxID=1355477 RepID=A0A810BIJ0_9BRAD|nr:hypothetical protein XF8B_58000 [Bradyrhizobium diazoefficiens]
MRTYSPFFQTLYDEVAPVGSLGRGTHYSVLRATVFHDVHGRRLPEGAKFADFAVIWDEDHDDRVIQPIERLYRSGDLSSFIMFGERKAGFYGVHASSIEMPAFENRLLAAHTALKRSCQSVHGDWWAGHLVGLGAPDGIINDSEESVVLYLRTINMLWRLGLKTIVEPEPPEAD